MDNQLIIIWTVAIVVAMGLDVGVYILLRANWKKTGISLTDRFWNQFYDQVKQLIKTWQNHIAIALVNYHKASVMPEPKPVSKPEPVTPYVMPNAVPVVPVEIIPVSVKTIGSVRRVQFSLEMPLDTQVEVRIGATREAGVTVEKREL